jgi:hypothetical protein
MMLRFIIERLGFDTSNIIEDKSSEMGRETQKIGKVLVRHHG